MPQPGTPNLIDALFNRALRRSQYRVDDAITLTSHSGGVRLEGLIVPEDSDSATDPPLYAGFLPASPGLAVVRARV